MNPGAMMITIGHFWYSLTADKHFLWRFPIIRTTFEGLIVFLTLLDVGTFFEILNIGVARANLVTRCPV